MKDNKKKFLIMGLLALVIVSVGAFQFMGSGSAPAPVAAKKAPVVAPTPDPALPKNPQFAMALAERDPFIAPNLPELQPPPTAPPVAPPTTVPNSVPHPFRGSRKMNFGPGPMSGSLPGTEPMGPGGLSGTTGPIGSGTAPIAVQPPPFAYTVSGVIVGDHPAAVFTDSTGNQRLVPLGGSIDSDTKVIGIEKGKVSLRFRGKTLRFEMGGNPNAK